MPCNGGLLLSCSPIALVAIKIIDLNEAVCYSRNHDYYDYQHGSTSYQRSGEQRRLIARVCWLRPAILDKQGRGYITRGLFNFLRRQKIAEIKPIGLIFCYCR